MKLWDKGAPAAEWVQAFTAGDDARWDTLLLPHDAEGTRAHAWALRQMGLLTLQEETAIGAVLDEVIDDARAGLLVVGPDHEDAHSVIETILTDRLGEAGRKIHAGRSRNDQVLVALRLWLRRELEAVSTAAARATATLIDLAEVGDELLMPGYTHLQRAMPTTAGLWAAGFAELLTDDLRGLGHARDRVNVSPWGSAAGFGVPHLDLPRDAVAARLGFASVQRHVTAVQLSRGKLEAAVVHALSQFTLTANRLASDLVLFATSEFGFVALAHEHTTGSSIMPQKRNPDVLELVRATHHRVAAELQLLLTLPAGLPSGYHRDLQLTKESVMRSTISTRRVLEVLAEVLPSIRWNAERMAAETTPELFATAHAIRRVSEGTPFRDAYREIAATIDDGISSPSPADALGAYRTPGTPGNVDIPALRRALAAARV
jgi:argininosuccinate lyase